MGVRHTAARRGRKLRRGAVGAGCGAWDTQAWPIRPSCACPRRTPPPAWARPSRVACGRGRRSASPARWARASAFPLAHFDLYRLRRPEEAWELGLDEALEDGCAVIEWPERLEGALPPDRLEVALALDADAAGGRVARLLGHGSRTGRERDLP